MKILDAYNEELVNTDIASKILGIVVLKYRQTCVSRAYTEALEESYGSLVFDAKVPMLVEVEAAEANKQAVVSDDSSRAGFQYRKIVEEIILREKQFFIKKTSGTAVPEVGESH